MEARPPKRFAVVADGRSLMRDLLRYLLEQQGIDIASEALTGAAAVEAVAEHRPDVVILHEAAAMDPPDAIGRIRTSAPEATLVILTADRSSTLPTLTSAPTLSSRRVPVSRIWRPCCRGRRGYRERLEPSTGAAERSTR
jgi:CheY-like chemotaxis protein